MIALTETPGGVRFSVKVVPGASRERIVGALGDALKIAVSKPPQDGQANAAVVKLLAKELGLSTSSISIVRGHGTPHKQICISGISVTEVEQRLAKVIKS